MTNNKKQVIRLRESDLHRIIKESVNKILKENKGLLREFGYDNEREDLIGMNLNDAISKLESEGWKWNPQSERRNGDTLEVLLYPASKNNRYGNVSLYIAAEVDNEKQTFNVVQATECYN